MHLLDGKVKKTPENALKQPRPPTCPVFPVCPVYLLICHSCPLISCIFFKCPINPVYLTIYCPVMSFISPWKMVISRLPHFSPFISKKLKFSALRAINTIFFQPFLLMLGNFRHPDSFFSDEFPDLIWSFGQEKQGFPTWLEKRLGMSLKRIPSDFTWLGSKSGLFYRPWLRELFTFAEQADTLSIVSLEPIGMPNIHTRV